MVDKTLSALITATQSELYQVAGISVQVYSEGLLAQKLSTAFDFIFDDYDWKRFYEFGTYTLDGTTGRMTTTVADTFKLYNDIRQVYPANSNLGLNKLPQELNPAFITGGSPRFYCADRVNTIRILPTTSEGSVVIVGQVRPADFALTDVVPFDSQALVMFAAWQYCVDDGANPASADKFQTMFDTRIKQLKNTETKESILLNGTDSYDYTSRWTER